MYCIPIISLYSITKSVYKQILLNSFTLQIAETSCQEINYEQF
jgi:hypothetical protein